MSLHFLLDGYNIIKQTSSLNRGTLEDQRHALLNWINAAHPQGSLQNSVTVVFDGQEEFFGAHSSSHIHVLFSKGESADDLIKRIAEKFPAKKRLVVVSNDKDITLYVRALGVGVVSVKEFTGQPAKAAKTSVKKEASSVSPTKYIPLTQQAKINKEFEKIWIKKDKGS